jgi:hypothetical protein
LQLDETITRMRRGASTCHITQCTSLLPPIKSSRTELAVLTALAQTYGPTILHDDPFGLVSDCIAERSAAVLGQRVLWGAVGRCAVDRAAAGGAHRFRTPVRHLARRFNGAGARLAAWFQASTLDAHPNDFKRGIV